MLVRCYTARAGDGTRWVAVTTFTSPDWRPLPVVTTFNADQGQRTAAVSRQTAAEALVAARGWGHKITRTVRR